MVSLISIIVKMSDYGWKRSGMEIKFSRWYRTLSDADETVYERGVSGTTPLFGKFDFDEYIE